MRQEPLRYKLSIFLTLVIGILMFQSVLFPSGFLIKENYMQGDLEGVNASDFSVLPYTIHINGNWSDTESTYDWCTGSGTWYDPYLIENVAIDAQNSGSCIFIENTDDYFIIHNCTVINGEASGGSAGIKLINVSNGTITQNSMTENYIGIYLTSGENISIIDNDIIDNPGQGIILFHSSENFVLNNNQTGSHYYGLFINADSNNNTVRGNTFQKNTGVATYGEGIKILNSQFNNIIKNILVDNDKGIRIERDSNNNTVKQNTITSNSEYGAFIIANPLNSTDNLFYLNYFDNPAYNAYDNGTDTLWDDGSIGNYWSDYSGTDANGDGIGDTPYILPGNGTGIDHFPIWDIAAPVITILEPLNNSRYNITAPAYSISIVEPNLDTYYYIISGSSGDYLRIINSLTGSIDQTLWDSLPAGTYTLTIYANDTFEHLGSTSITIIKEILPSSPPAIPFGSFYLILATISVATILTSIRLKLKLKRQV